MKMEGPTEAELDSLKSLFEDIRIHIEDRRWLIDEEIRNYPTPIPNCDAQFNHLLEQRTKLWQELERINAIDEKRLSCADYIELIEDFIESPLFAEDGAEQSIGSSLRARLTQLGG